MANKDHSVEMSLMTNQRAQVTITVIKVRSHGMHQWLTPTGDSHLGLASVKTRQDKDSNWLMFRG